MKILPRRISKMTTISTSPGVNYGLHIDAVDKDRSIMILGKKLNENVDETVLKDLVDKYAYASALLYFAENFKIIDNINKNDLLEDINVLLHSRCRVVKEKAPELTKIGDYPLYEGTNYVLRGDGENKIRECFNLKEDVEMGDISMNYLNNAKVDEVIKDFVVCPHCKNVFEEESIKIDYPDIPDDYTGPVDDEPLGYECPYCGFHSVNEESFSDAWLDDLKDAPNIGEYLDIPINEDAGTQASDIAAKVDYTFQSAPTPANPGKKKKFEAVEIKELDESTHLNLTGFIKDVNGLYRRGNYVVVKESDTNKITVVHQSRLNEEIEDIKEEPVTSESIAKELEDKLNQVYKDRFKIKTTPVDEAYALVITDSNKDNANDLVEVTDTVNSALESLNYSKKDYEINYKRNNLVVIIYKTK